MEIATRKEKMIEAILKDDPSLIPVPVSREEMLLASMAVATCEGGGGGGVTVYSYSSHRLRDNDTNTAISFEELASALEKGPIYVNDSGHLGLVVSFARNGDGAEVNFYNASGNYTNAYTKEVSIDT